MLLRLLALVLMVQYVRDWSEYDEDEWGGDLYSSTSQYKESHLQSSSGSTKQSAAGSSWWRRKAKPADEAAMGKSAREIEDSWAKWQAEEQRTRSKEGAALWGAEDELYR